jgi:bla regulator protein blaR1
MLRSITCYAAILLFDVGVASTQPAAKPLEFEVAAIKPADPDAHGSSMMTDRAGGLNATNMPLRALITAAYGIRDFQLSGGPGWVGTERFDIIAKPERVESSQEPPDPRAMTDEQRKLRNEQWNARVRALLADRFALVVHTETKEQPVYLLTVAKNGPKLTVVTTPGDRQGTSGGRGRSQGFAATMSMLANTLSNATGRPVIDKTGLTGKYDYILEWTPDAGPAGPAGSDAPQPVDSPGPTIFTALQEQLGLKLESSKGPVENIVIDHVDHPSAN